jgi:hypothetical protein
LCNRLKFLIPVFAKDDLRALARTRPVGYGLIRAGVRTDSMIGVTKFSNMKTRRTCRREIPLRYATPDHTVPYGTALSRDALADIRNSI